MLLSGLIDLHTHTTASDGIDSPAELVRKASERGIAILGIADHDSTAGIAEASAEAIAIGGIEVIPAVELNAKEHDATVHVLGYFIDPNDATLQAHFRNLVEQRRVRMGRMAALLHLNGVDLSPLVIRRLMEKPVPGRPHLADALVNSGFADDRTDAFNAFLVRGKPGYVPKESLTPLAVIAIVRAAGGVPVLAHPLTPGTLPELPDRLKRYAQAGLRGMEVHYALYDDVVRTELLQLANAYDLVPTGGSDFHGDGQKPGPTLGEVNVPAESLARLRALAAL